MAKLTSLWHQYLIEPSKWIFYCFFQPVKFRQSIEVPAKRARLERMWKLALPLFIYSYPLALATRFLLANSFRAVYSFYFNNSPSLSTLAISPFIFDATWASLLALLAAVIAGTLFGLSYGITGGLAAIFWGGVVVHTGLGSPGYLSVAITVVAVVGLVVGVAIGSARDITNRSRVGTGIGGIIGLLLGAPWGFPLGIGVAEIVGVFIYTHLFLSRQQGAVVSSATSAVLSAAAGALVAGILTGIVRGILRERILDSGVERALSVGTATCIAVSATIGGVMGTAYGKYGQAGLNQGISHFILPNILVVPVFLLCYMLGYYRLPLYVVSGTSSLLALLASHRTPTQACAHLRRSALYWDEGVFLPLPGLRTMLSYAANKAPQEALEVITFIIAQRPSQTGGARPVLREITFSDLKARSTIELIAQAFEATMIPPEAMLIDPHWHLSLIRFEDASREAARYCAPLGRIARRDALHQMIFHLKQIKMGQLGDLNLEVGLRTLANTWLEVAQNELETLKLSAEDIGAIDDPYICGPALRPTSRAHTSQFVGRRDLGQHIEQELRKGIYRPCFFLIGERRMGKTSLLNHLPLLLGTRYLPVTFDLQQRGISSNAAAFLAEIAQAIQTVMRSRGIPIRPLEYAALNEVRRENEAAVYRHFDLWLRQVETELEKEDRTILIAFDEFEKLAEAGKHEFLTLTLLQDWFRSVMQNHPHLAFLFSGVKTVGEMQGNWSGYFVNVQTLKVSFLAPTDAFRLITQPTNDYPSEQIFGEGVVEEIMRVTGNHPFLIQALCHEIITLLNNERRGQADVADVEQAVKEVCERWYDTYFVNLWERTSPKQRTCLQALTLLGKASLQQIVEQSGLDQRSVEETVQILRRRDLILPADNQYQIASLIFGEWIFRCQENQNIEYATL